MADQKEVLLEASHLTKEFKTVHGVVMQYLM